MPATTNRARGRATLAIIAASLIIIAAPALAAGEFTVRSSLPVALSGSISAEILGGSGRVHDASATGEYVLMGLTGTLTITKEQAVRRDVAGHDVLVTTAGPTDTAFDMANATLIIDLAQQEFTAVLVTDPDGVVSVKGATNDVGSLTLTDRAMNSQLLGNADDIQYRWPAGSHFVGNDADFEPLAGFPKLAAPELTVSGGAQFRIFGGTASFTDSSGQPHSARLGSWDEGSAQNQSWITFRGVASRASIPLTAKWGFAGPSIAWKMNGTVAWEDATGAGVIDGERVTFAKEEVSAAGVFAVRPTPPADSLGGSDQSRYAGTGEVTAFTVGTTRIEGVRERLPIESIAAASAVVGLGAVVAIGLKIFAVFYTRRSTSEILAHPTRRAIHAAVLAANGIHKRELHRGVGGAWGPFTYHLRVLATAGFVRTQLQGKYSLIVPVAADSLEVNAAIPHPIARAIFDAVPERGGVIAFAALRDEVGVSRQLLTYHLRGLEKRGLVRMVGDRSRQRSVARANSDTEDARAALPTERPHLRA